MTYAYDGLVELLGSSEFTTTAAIDLAIVVVLTLACLALSAIRFVVGRTEDRVAQLNRNRVVAEEDERLDHARRRRSRTEALLLSGEETRSGRSRNGLSSTASRASVGYRWR